MSNIHRVRHTDDGAQELSELILEMHEMIADKIHGSQLRRRTRTVEDAFMVVAGHIVYAIAARRTELNGTSMPILIGDLCAVIEMNAMEMHSKEKNF